MTEISLNFYITFFIFVLGLINLTRVLFFIVGADIYRIKRLKMANFYEKNPLVNYPFLTIILPAYNEEKTVSACIESFTLIDYPKDKLNVLLVDDGSKDNTVKVAKNLLSKRNPWIKILEKENGGKASAINYGIKNANSNTEIVVCLDSDCSIARDGLSKIAQYFDYYPSLMALASHVTILPEKTLLNMAQEFEYLVSYQLKRALSVFNLEYIIGGIGSSFRYKDLLDIGLYDSDTMTEDIDLTMKLIRINGNKKRKVFYADDVITYAEAVPDLKGLIKQRFRWKFGRLQTFYKNRKLFFNFDRKYNWWLNFIYLPVEVVFELIFLLQPLILLWFFYITIRYQDVSTLFGAYIFISVYTIVSILGEDKYPFERRLALFFYSIINFFINYYVSLSEYFALIMSLKKLPNLKKSISHQASKWVSPERTGVRRS